MCRLPACALALTALLWALPGCSDEEDADPASDRESITPENVLGTWYSCEPDPGTGTAVVTFAAFGTDSSARVGLLNCDQEVTLISTTYHVSDNVLAMATPEVDTARQNALQIIMASQLSGVTMDDRAYIENGNLVFMETFRKVVFTRAVPSQPGGRITGTLYFAGDFNQGAAQVVCVDTATYRGQSVFMDAPGSYCLKGLRDGTYMVVAVYIPKECAVDYPDRLYECPSADYPDFVAVSGADTVNGIDITLNPLVPKSVAGEVGARTREAMLMRIAEAAVQL